MAAMLEAARAIATDGSLEGDLLVALVVDEEDRSQWVGQLVERMRARGLRPTAGIIPEPTDLAVVHAHKGFSWGRIETVGHAAHGSDHKQGIDAIALIGRVIQRLELLDLEDLPRRVHPLLGRASLHCSLISGGTERSTYPDRCSLDTSGAPFLVRRQPSSATRSRPSFRPPGSLARLQWQLRVTLRPPATRGAGGRSDYSRH